MMQLIIIFLASLFLFTFGISTQEIISFDSRFYLFALEMWQNGPTWFPTTYHQPYPDYTAASTFLIYLTASVIGMNKLAAVLPTAIAASLTMVITYSIAAIHDKRWGLSAICFMLLTFTFFKSARGIALDMYPTLFTAICFYLVYTARTKWIYPFIFLSFVFRGPIGLVMPVGVVCAYFLTQRNFKAFFTTGFISLFILIACGAGLIALAHHAGGSEFVQDVLRMQIVGRMGEDKLPFYFYFTNGMLNYALAFPAAVIVFLFARRNKTLLPFFAWAFIILIGMSIPGEKKTRYILPFVPAIALIASYPFVNKVSVRNLKLLFATVVIFIITMLTVIEPMELYRDRAHDFVMQLETQRKQAKAKLIFYKIGHDGMPIKYLINMPQEETPIFVNDEKELTPSAFIIAKEAEFEKLFNKNYKVIARDSIGHVKVVVFTTSH